MKTRLFLLTVAVLFLAGCRTKHVVTRESQSLSLIDTTKVETDSTGATSSLVDTTKVEVESSLEADVEFVDGGGSVTVDAQGNVTLSGVKSLRGSSSLRKAVENGITDKEQASSTIRRQSNGIAKDERMESHGETTVYTPPWYESLMARLAGWIMALLLIVSIFRLIKKRLRR